MSRTDNQNHIWQVRVPIPNKGQLQAYRSQKIGENSTLLFSMPQINYNGSLSWLFFSRHEIKDNKSALFILMQLILNDADRANKFKMHVSIPGKFGKTGVSSEVWMHILGFNLGWNTEDILGHMEGLGNYALGLFKPNLLSSKSDGLVSVVTFRNPHHIVEAVLHGDEKMLKNMLKTNPDLTKTGIAIDFSGRTFTGTALQAAIACGDFTLNKKSIGLCELIVENLKQQYPDSWQQIVHDQTLELYTKSLRFYVQKQSEKIDDLYRRMREGEKIDLSVITAAEKRLEVYHCAVHSKSLKTIIEAHTNLDLDPDSDSDPANTKDDAQKDHVIGLDQVLFDAIANATDAEIQAVLDDPTIDSPLSNLIKQFRKDVDGICQSEIIANPQHLLKLLTRYDEFYIRVTNTDQNWNKRELFWCHLVGYVQRYLPACDAQVFAHPGLCRVVKDGDKITRSFYFKWSGYSMFPLSIDSNSGLGYKFAAGSGGCVASGVVDAGMWAFYKTYLKQKQQTLRKLSRMREPAPASLSVVLR